MAKDKRETKKKTKLISGKPKSKASGTGAPKGKASEPKPRKSRAPKEKTGKTSAGKVALIVVLAVVLLGAVTVGFGVFAGRSDTIHPNLELDGIPVGGMTVDEAEQALSSGGWEAREDASVLVKLPAGYEFTVTAEEVGLTMNSREAAQAAYDFGHSGSVTEDLAAYFKCIFGKAGTGDILGKANADVVRVRIDEAVTGLNAKLREGYVVDTESELLCVIKGADKVKLEPELLYELVLAAFEEGSEVVEYPFEATDAEASCNFSSIHDKIFAEPLDAKYDPETQKATESAIGIDFDIAEADRLFAEADIGDVVEIPLTVTMPKYTQEQLDAMLFRDKLGSKTTSYATSDSNRAANVELSASKINGVVLNPGDIFSYNDVVGKRTAAAGFKSAAAYAGGKVVQEIGGGICQTSSTLYCAALYANLKITARDCHHFPVSYLPYGLDATVSWGGPEFKFQNSRDLPVKIVTHCENRQLTVEIWGTDIDGSYVEMTYGSSTGETGISATTYRCVYDKDGNLLSRTLEANSFYYFHTEEEEEPEPTPTPEPTPEPTQEPGPEPTQEPEPTDEPVPPPENTAE